LIGCEDAKQWETTIKLKASRLYALQRRVAQGLAQSIALLPWKGYFFT